MSPDVTLLRIPIAAVIHAERPVRFVLDALLEHGAPIKFPRLWLEEMDPENTMIEFTGTVHLWKDFEPPSFVFAWGDMP